MADKHTLRIVATGQNGEELTTTTEVEAKTPEGALNQFRENTAGVSYWDLTVEIGSAEETDTD